MTTTLLLILFALILICLLRQKWKFRAIRHIPGPPEEQFLFVINALRNRKKMLSLLLKMAKNYGSVVKVMLNPWEFWLVVTDRKMAEFFLRSTKFIRKTDNYSYMYPWLGNGLLTAEGEEWQKFRRLITPAFHFKMLDEFIPTFDSACDIFIDCLSKEVNKESFDIYPYVAAFTLDIIAETAMGANINAQKNPRNDYVNAVHLLSNIVIKRTIDPWMKIEFLFKLSHYYSEQKKAVKLLNGMTDTLIQERKKWLLENMNDSTYKSGYIFDSNEKKKTLFLDILLQSTLDGEPVNDEVIRNAVNGFMFAGYDTTASTISLMINALANNPNVQNKVVEELKSIYGNDKNRPTTTQDISEMKYMELVIKEVLRFYSPVPIIGRKLVEDVEYNGTVLPKGLLLLFYIYGIHRSPKLFDDPDSFNPERFLSPTAIKPYSFIPFSAGPKNCLGQKYAMYEVKVTFAKLLRHFEFLSAGSEYKPQLTPELVMKSLNGIRVRIKLRNF